MLNRLPGAAVLTVLVSSGVWSAGASAQVGTSPHEITPLIEEYCFGCHGSETQTAGINLSALVAQRPLVKKKQTWERIREVLAEGKMPPANARQPSPDLRDRMVSLLYRDIEDFDYSAIDDPGFELMRRLTHTEYNNTIRDLFGVDFDLTDRLPDELTGSSGFENSANTLFLQPALMERYIAVAEGVVELALPDQPITETHLRSHSLVFVAEPGGELSQADAAGVVLRRFLLRSYRRPPSEDEVSEAVAQYLSGRSAGLVHRSAIKQVLQAVLISPKFLLRVEAGEAGRDPFPVNDWELASRLSYFLWASMPDDELFELAEQGLLSEETTLEEQVARMLNDRRSDTLGSIFAAQWLGFQHVGTRIWLDPIDNPWSTASLMTAMRDESSLFFLSLLRDNRPIKTLIDADYTYVNEELAKTLYGMEDIRGDHMRRVLLEDPNRGGVLGQPSVLAVTSNYKDTSPVKRGNYVLDVLLGTPPPPPPPNAGVLSEEVADLRGLSFREKLEMHASNETCRTCHSKIDPIGFSLENFDYFGRWRDSYHSRERVEDPAEADETVEIQTETSPEPVLRFYKNTHRLIGAAGLLPDGTSFTGPAGLKRALLETRHSDLVRQVSAKMLAYALGRQLEYFDEPALHSILGALEKEGYLFKTLLREIVTSYPFRYKKNPSQESN